MTKKEYHKVISCFYDRNKIVNVIRPKYVNNNIAIDFIDNYILGQYYDIRLDYIKFLDRFDVEFYDNYRDYTLYYNIKHNTLHSNRGKFELNLQLKYNLNYDEIKELISDIMKHIKQ